ncbi:MAG: TatD family hydrolase [Alphaproteobacteria bacterium]|nr:TatD family hydrolase [Alphaproteobacteria bacterium]
MFFIDSHCHLDVTHMGAPFVPHDNTEELTDMVIQRAFDADVKYMLNIGTKLSDVEVLKAVTDKYANIFRTVGIHPLEAKYHVDNYTDDEIVRIINENCVLPKVVGIGEIGLDYHYDEEHKTEQQKLFHLQMELAQQHNLPVSIHSRDAFDDTAEILATYPKVKGVMHCFSGSREFMKQMLDLGYYISISGIVTYKKATDLQDIVKYVSLDRLLIETDSPFLAPVPHRGKVNEPAFVTLVAEKIAEILETSVKSIATATSENFFNLFSLARNYAD